jgi:hypothetical protein
MEAETVSETLEVRFMLTRPMIQEDFIKFHTWTSSSSFLGSTAQLKPWPPPQNLAEFLGGFSTIFFFTA